MRILKKLYLAIFFGKRFYLLISAVVFIFILSYAFPVLFYMAVALLLIVLASALTDFFLLFIFRNSVLARRLLPEKLSNGDENIMRWEVVNGYPFAIHFELLDEFPEPWQIRDFSLMKNTGPGETAFGEYVLKPKERGEFSFGNLHVYIKSPLQLLVRRKTFISSESIRVFPAYLRLRQFEFMAHITDPGHIGYKQVRKTGHSQEFEQIREYVSGDDIRSINWKATGRTGGQMMINVYTDEKSQQIYCIVDKGRTMKMAFGGLSLLDHAVNAILALTSVAITRQDKAGLISFGDKTGEFLPANYRSTQMAGIVQALYNLNTKFLESDYAFLHKLIKTNITQRSLLILFTNFESLSALDRQLPYLRNIAKRHLLLVVFFENTSLQNLVKAEAGTVERVYEQVIAEKFFLEKKLIVKELHRFGIAALLTTPERLSVDTINKYLEIKARREI